MGYVIPKNQVFWSVWKWWIHIKIVVWMGKMMGCVGATQVLLVLVLLGWWSTTHSHVFPGFSLVETIVNKGAAEGRQNPWWNPFCWVWFYKYPASGKSMVNWVWSVAELTILIIVGAFCSVLFAASNASAMVRTSDSWSQIPHCGQLESSSFTHWLKWVKGTI